MKENTEEVYTESEVRKIKDSFYREIERKEKEIEELKKHNKLLLKTALKNAEDRHNLDNMKKTLDQ